MRQKWEVDISLVSSRSKRLESGWRILEWKNYIFVAAIWEEKKM